MNKFLFGIVPVLFASNAAGQTFIGHFSTVTESECNYEIILSSSGQGEFLETCRREDGSGVDDIEKQNITWIHKNDVITATIGGSEQHFEYVVSLSCSSFGSKGASDGLVGYGMQFWRAPIKCK